MSHSTVPVTRESDRISAAGPYRARLAMYPNVRAAAPANEPGPVSREAERAPGETLTCGPSRAAGSRDAYFRFGVVNGLALRLQTVLQVEFEPTPAICTAPVETFAPVVQTAAPCRLSRSVLYIES